MITRYRNQAFKLFGVSALLLVLLFLTPVLRTWHTPRPLVATYVITLAALFLVLYSQASMALARAKGYDGAIVWAFIIVATLGLGGIFFAMPLLIWLGLKDKIKRRRHSHTRDSGPATMNPIAQLPPRRTANPLPGAPTSTDAGKANSTPP